MSSSPHQLFFQNKRALKIFPEAATPKGAAKMLHHTNHSEFEKQKTQMVVKYLRQENPSWESWSFPEALLLFLKKKKKN